MKRIFTFLTLVMLFSSLFAQKPYRGAEVYSTDEVLYGKFVMNMKMVKGSGMLSTFFTYKGTSHEAGAFWEEIDIEILGKNNATVFSTNIITDGVTGDNTMDEEQILFDYSLADDFHVYTLVWTPDSVVWYLDDTLVRREIDTVVQALSSPEGYRFNAWISCSADWVGVLNRSQLPQYQYVDWIEYYSYNSGTYSLEWRDDFDSFNSSRWLKANWTFDCNQVDFSPDNVYTEGGNLVLALTDPNPPNAVHQVIEGSEVIQFNYVHSAKELMIKLREPGQYDIQIYNLQGKSIVQDKIVDETGKIASGSLVPGIYLLNVQSDKVFETKKVVID